MSSLKHSHLLIILITLFSVPGLSVETCDKETALGAVEFLTDMSDCMNNDPWSCTEISNFVKTTRDSLVEEGVLAGGGVASLTLKNYLNTKLEALKERATRMADNFLKSVPYAAESTQASWFQML